MKLTSRTITEISGTASAHVYAVPPPTARQVMPVAVVEASERRAPGSRRSVVRRAQTAADAAALTLAAMALVVLQRLSGGEGTDFRLFAVILVPCWLVLSCVHRLHLLDEERADHSTPDDLVRVFQALLAAVFVAAGLETLFGLEHAPTFRAVAAVVVIGYPLLVVLRAVARGLARRRPGYRQRALVVGAGEVGQLIARKLGARSEYGIDFIGFVDPRADAPPAAVAVERVLGDLQDLERLVMAHDVHRVFMSFSLESDHRLADVARRLERIGVQVDIVPRLFELVGPRANLHTVEGLPMIGLPICRPSRPVVWAKRGIDIVVAGLGLIAASPILALIAMRIRMDSPGLVFYRSQRIGAGGQPFGLAKFRTMSSEFCRGDGYGGAAAELAFAELMTDPKRRQEFERSHKLKSDPRVTKVGAWLRRTSLDELPQLINVIKGDMTLVGPRAITTDEWDALLANGGTGHRPGPAPYWHIEGLRPGVTGWWQIHGRSNTTYDERVRLDATYASSISLRLDLLIIARTVRTLFTHDGAY